MRVAISIPLQPSQDDGEVTIAGITRRFVIDTGAVHSFIGGTTAHAISAQTGIEWTPLDTPLRIAGIADAGILVARNTITVDVDLAFVRGARSHVSAVTFYVVPGMRDAEVIFGKCFFNSHTGKDIQAIIHREFAPAPADVSYTGTADVPPEPTAAGHPLVVLRTHVDSDSIRVDSGHTVTAAPHDVSDAAAVVLPGLAAQLSVHTIVPSPPSLCRQCLRSGLDASGHSGDSRGD